MNMNRFSVNKKILFELAVLLVISVGVFVVAGKYDILERIVEFTRDYEDYELDELITLSIVLTFCFAVFSFRRWLEVRKSNQRLQKAMKEIKQLKGIIPMCASCKKVRRDQNYWQQVESYMAEHSDDLKFTHSVCPDCFEKLYSQYQK